MSGAGYFLDRFDCICDLMPGQFLAVRVLGVCAILDDVSGAVGGFIFGIILSEAWKTSENDLRNHPLKTEED